MSQPFKLKITRRARRALSEAPPSGLPEAVAAAVLAFITGALLDNPHRVGKPLMNELAGKYAARRGVYRVIYEIDEKNEAVVVLHIDHRGDVYRT